MGLIGSAALVGYAEYPAIRKYTGARSFTIEQWADLTSEALGDAGLTAADINGVVVGEVRETQMFGPATVVEYLGQPVNFAERVDLGGAGPVGMVWRAAAAIELGVCDVVVCAMPALPIPSNPTPRTPDPRRYFGCQQQSLGIPAGRVRDTLRQPGAELRLRDDRPALCRCVRLRQARDGKNRR